MPWSVVANDVHAVDPLEKRRIDTPDHIGQDGVHQIVRGARQHTARLERRLTGTQEALPPLAANQIMLDISEQADAVQRMQSIVARVRSRIVTAGDRLHLGACQDVPGQTKEERIQIEITDVGRDFGQILVRDLVRRLVHRLLQAILVSSLVGPKCDKPVADGHQIAGSQQRVPANVLERVLLLACVGIRHAGAAEERLERTRAYAPGQHHAVVLDEPDVVHEDLAQALRRVHDVHGYAPILLNHRRSLRQAGVRLLADRRKDFEMVVDAPNLIGDLDQAELGEVPDVGRQFPGHAGVHREVLDVLVEVLVDAIDEDRQR